MWRRERSGAEVLRLGRHSVERWASVEGSLSLLATQALPLDVLPTLQTLASAMHTLYTTPTRADVTVVIESIWLPVMRVDTGSAWLRASQVEALVRHRFGMYEWGPLDPVSQWELRIEHRAGTRGALAYGFSPALKQTITTTAQSLGVKLAAMTPAFAWGLGRFRLDKAWSRTAGWWLWPEQDRTLVARIDSGETVYVNAGAATAQTDAAVLRLVEAECARWGLGATPGPVAAAGWDVVPIALDRGNSASVVWMGVRGRSPLSVGRVLARQVGA